MPAGEEPREKGDIHSTQYFTPPRVLNPVRAYFHSVCGSSKIALDPATDPSNPTEAEDFADGIRRDGLKMLWRTSRSVFLNPPFGPEIWDWIEKISDEAENGCHLVALLPGQRLEQERWQDWAMNRSLSAACFVKKRVAFIGPDGKARKSNPYGSILLCYNGCRYRFAEHVGELGIVFDPVVLRR